MSPNPRQLPKYYMSQGAVSKEQFSTSARIMVQTGGRLHVACLQLVTLGDVLAEDSERHHLPFAYRHNTRSSLYAVNQAIVICVQIKIA